MTGSLIAKRLRGLQPARNRRGNDPGQGGKEDRGQDNEHQVAGVGMGRHFAELVKPLEDGPAARETRYQKDKVVPEMQEGEPQHEPPRSSHDPDQDALEAEAKRDRAAARPKRPQQSDLPGL